MLDRGKNCSSAVIATALAASGDKRINLDRAVLSFQYTNDRYACNNENVYAVPLHEGEWIDPDSIDAEISKLVAGSSTITTARNNPRRCCRTSTSSGYSSHSPPLSAGSYSCYASATGCQGSFAIRDQFGRGLAVIHEGETIPRPIWPSGPREFYHDDTNAEYDLEHLRAGIYACCGCTYPYSYCDWDLSQTSATAKSAREVLLELSRTLNSVIESETNITPEEVLHNISHTVAQGMGLQKACYEHACYSSLSPINPKSSGSSVNGKTSTAKGTFLLNSGKNPSPRGNPINSKLYSNPRHMPPQNYLWNVARCSCENKKNFENEFQSAKAEVTEITDTENKKTKDSIPSIYLVPQERTKISSAACACKHFDASGKAAGKKNAYTSNLHGKMNMKEPIGGLVGDVKQNRNCLGSSEPEYTTQLECSDGSSSGEAIIVSSPKSEWSHQSRGFGGDLDFTLDVTRAERLGRAIAKAKRKRQWCRALTALFGLVFFVLSVVIVSLSVTRGRKVFGSM